ncbi:RagB/SusD family nutrient uptake outer membrane protein [Flavobacteriaceae bacterium F08102]|nr:RagB/SusD family nutrient uptake outer membrane protein [Flavobacteriaceae bacterium F08102]
MKKLFYISFITLLFSVSSCSDFLDREPSFSLNETNAITNFSKAEAAIGGVYATFRSDNWSGSLYVALASKAGFVNWKSGEYAMEYSQDNNPGSSYWSAFYGSLNAANFAINGATNLPEASVPSEAAREALIAEGRCLRAWINANLLWNFAHWWADDSDEYGILYRDQVVDLGNVEKARLTVGESYAKIYEDLDYAIANLPSFTSPRTVSKEFAKVLKAKLLLYRGGYNDNTAELNEALTLVNDVLNSSPAGFSMQEDLAQVYEDSWDSQENLFVRYLDDNGRRSYDAGYWYAYGLAQIVGDRLPLGPGETLTAGLEFGLDWFKADPRWDIVTGEVRGAETWDNTMYYTWPKLTRLGRYAGQQASPPNEKYAAYYFRYPELYIMKAELLARTGASIADAIAPINTMRSIRTNPVLPALNPGSQSELMDLIFKEYFLETFLENGSEFFAALRFDKAGSPWIETIKGGKVLEENKICYPIPDAEMVNNKLMKQNPDLE